VGSTGAEPEHLDSPGVCDLKPGTLFLRKGQTAETTSGPYHITSRSAEYDVRVLWRCEAGRG
jgi:hypothetical protein